MANDAFMKPEVPDSFRDLMKVSIEQNKARVRHLCDDERADVEDARDELADGE